MNVEKQVSALIAEIREKGKFLRWLRAHQSQLEPLPEGSVYASGSSVDFDNLEHKDVIRVVRSLGGKWDKTTNSHAVAGEIRVDYAREVDGVQVRCWAGKPPPSCRLVEYEEIIPEQIIPAKVVKRTKLVCAGQADPLTVALAQANSQKPSTSQS